MLRWLYIQFIWLHPAPFRWRFGDDMLDDFDRASNRARLRYLADAPVSLARQWLLRPEYRRVEAPAATAEALLGTEAAPLFQTFETYRPRPAALLHGGLLALLSIIFAVLVMSKGGGTRPFIIGVHDSSPSELPVDRNSVDAKDLNTTVKVAPDPFEAWLKLARPYFASMPVLRALDVDHNLALSPWEIATAPAALRKLDINYDGKLTAEECGLRIAPNSVQPAFLARVHQRFMGFHPVLAVLDTDGDGEISASEIARAAAALKELDANGDGYLTADELIPFQMAVRAGLR
jgi:EF hand